MALSLLHDLAPSTAISTEVRFSAGSSGKSPRARFQKQASVMSEGWRLQQYYSVASRQLTLLCA
jgi:hypothetical protein